MKTQMWNCKVLGMERDEGRISQSVTIKYPIECQFGYFLTDAKMLFLYNGTSSYRRPLRQ